SVLDLNDIDDSIVLGQEYVNIQKLGACLSLADICHADDSRAPMIVFTYLTFDDESETHWKRHMQISGVTRRGNKLVMSAMVFSDEGAEAVNEYKESIEKQLQIVRPYFHSELYPISQVELKLKRRESQIDQALSFQTNMSAILNMLIEGVYQRAEVFVRELIQNSLDACYLQTARAFRRNEHYEPRIVITSYYNAKDETVAVRIDDNGFGMDISDIKDTLLLIGGSVVDKESIRKLLQSTTQKNLIATFGIGLLSCFKVADKIEVRTAKDGATPVELSFSGLSDPIYTKESSDTKRGTTIILTLKSAYIKELSVRELVLDFCRMTIQTDILTMELDWDEEALEYSRDRIMRLSQTEAKPLEFKDLSSNICYFELYGDDFTGWLWLPSNEIVMLESGSGSIEILNDGIFVSNEGADVWLPKHLSMCSGMLNFAAKAIDLSTSRDQVIKNKKSDLKRAEVSTKSQRMYSVLAAYSKSSRKFAVLALTRIWNAQDKNMRKGLLKSIDDLYVVLYGTKKQISLHEILKRSPRSVYLYYSQGRFVEELVQFDGRMLYYTGDDESKLQATLLTQDGKLVIECERKDPRDINVIEAELLIDYFKLHKFKVVDLRKETPIKLRSKPIPREIRDKVGSRIKFIEIMEMPKTRAWRVGNETWINLANPGVSRMYKSLRYEPASEELYKLGTIFFQLLAFDIDTTIRDLLDWMSEIKKQNSQHD
ncbi:ATP-binding protein, partial [Candidatus Latescibacterota bacterium]